MYRDSSVVITGIGVVSAAGTNNRLHWRQVIEGKNHISKLDERLQEYMPFKYGSLVENFDIKGHLSNNKLLRTLSKANRFAFAAAGMALEDACIGTDIAPERKGLFFLNGLGYVDENDLQASVEYCSENGHFSYDMMGLRGMRLINPMLPLKALPNIGLGAISVHYGFQGANLVASPFSPETVVLLQEAVGSIRRDESDICIVGGADAPFCVSNMGSLIGYTEKSDINIAEDGIDNIVLAEGAVFIVLERLERAVERGQHIYGILGEITSVNSGIERERDLKLKEILKRVSIGQNIPAYTSSLILSSYDNKKAIKFNESINGELHCWVNTKSFDTVIGYMASAQALLNICHACFIMKETDETIQHINQSGVTIMDWGISGRISVVDVKKYILH